MLGLLFSLDRVCWVCFIAGCLDFHGRRQNQFIWLCERKLVMTGQFPVDTILYQALHNPAKEELSCSQCGRCAATVGVQQALKFTFFLQEVIFAHDGIDFQHYFFLFMGVYWIVLFFVHSDFKTYKHIFISFKRELLKIVVVPDCLLLTQYYLCII